MVFMAENLIFWFVRIVISSSIFIPSTVIAGMGVVESLTTISQIWMSE